MTVFDTNYLVRHIVQDDKTQCKKVASIIQAEAKAGRAIRIYDLVLVETGWVLKSVYGYKREEWAAVVDDLLTDPIFQFEDHLKLRVILERFRNGKADFADYFILAQAEEEDGEIKTFDRNLLHELN